MLANSTATASRPMNVDEKNLPYSCTLKLMYERYFTHRFHSLILIYIVIQLFSYIVQFEFKINHFIPIIFNYYYSYYSPFLIE